MTTTLRIRNPGRIGAVLSAFLLLLAAPLAWAQGRNAVESINFSSVQGGKIVVKVGLKEPLKEASPGAAAKPAGTK